MSTRLLNAAFSPYEDLADPFRIGLSPLDPAHLIVPGPDDAEALREKRELLAADRDAVFRERLDSRCEQAEAASLIARNLATYHARAIPRTDEPPLLEAALAVQEDLLLMRRVDGDWHLVAGSLSFPSSWSLREKFDRSLTRIHAPVPRLEERMGGRIRRVFGMMTAAQPMWRQNWSIHGDGERRHARSETERHDWDAAVGVRPFLRLEYQTLTKLAETGAVLFTVRIFSRPFDALPSGLAATLAEQLRALADDEADYKGLAIRRGELIERLERT